MAELHVLTNPEITRKLLNNPFLSDVSFEVQGVTLYAHSLELAKKSPIFALQFKGNYGERKLIKIDNVRYEHFYEFLAYIYCASCKTNEDNLIGLLRLAIKYEIYDLESLIWDFYQDKDNPTPLLTIRLLNFCVEENYNALLNFSKYFTALHFSEIINEGEFLSISQNTLKCILEYDSIGDTCNEKFLFDGVVKWLNSNRSKIESNTGVLKKITDDLLKYIRFPCISEEEFRKSINLQPDLFSVAEVDAMLKSILKGEKENRITLSLSNNGKFDCEARTIAVEFEVKKPAMLKGIFMNFQTSREIIIKLSLLSENKSILKTISYRSACKYHCLKYIINLHKPYQLQSMQGYKLEIFLESGAYYYELPSIQPNVVISTSLFKDKSGFYSSKNWLKGLIFDS